MRLQEDGAIQKTAASILVQGSIVGRPTTERGPVLEAELGEQQPRSAPERTHCLNICIDSIARRRFLFKVLVEKLNPCACK